MKKENTGFPEHNARGYSDHHAINGGKEPTPFAPDFDGPASAVGSGYPAEFFTNPWNMGIDGLVGYEDTDRTLRSTTLTTRGPGIDLHDGNSYNSYWVHEVSPSVEKSPLHKKGGRQ